MGWDGTGHPWCWPGQPEEVFVLQLWDNALCPEMHFPSCLLLFRSLHTSAPSSKAGRRRGLVSLQVHVFLLPQGRAEQREQDGLILAAYQPPFESGSRCLGPCSLLNELFQPNLGPQSPQHPGLKEQVRGC